MALRDKRQEMQLGREEKSRVDNFTMTLHGLKTSYGEEQNVVITFVDKVFRSVDWLSISNHLNGSRNWWYVAKMISEKIDEIERGYAEEKGGKE